MKRILYFSNPLSPEAFQFTIRYLQESGIEFFLYQQEFFGEPFKKDTIMTKIEGFGQTMLSLVDHGDIASSLDLWKTMIEVDLQGVVADDFLIELFKKYHTEGTYLRNVPDGTYYRIADHEYYGYGIEIFDPTKWKIAK